MDGCFSTGCFTNGRRRAANCISGLRFSSVCLTLAALCSLVTPAYGQLRSGSTSRSLYADQVGAPKKTPAPQRAASGRVVPASGTQVKTPKLAHSSSQQDRSRQAAADSPVRTASYSELDAIADGERIYSDDGLSYADNASSGYEVLEPRPHYGGRGCSGCDGYGGCDGGCRIAPTCSTVCPPGCGPLMALWCRMSVRAEVPLYWRRAAATPPLVTTAPSSTNSDIAGQLGRNSTEILLGNGILDESVNAGFRLTLGTWLGQDECYGLMFRYWNAGDQENNYTFHSNQFPVLARPFLNTTISGSPAQDTQLVAYPGDSVGNISVASRSEVSGLDLTLKRLLYQDRFTRIDWLYGYQRMRIEEQLGISSNTTVTGNLPALQGATLAVTDLFTTDNEFNGVSYGLMSTREFACWKMETMFRLGLGNLRRQVNIAGSTTSTSGGTTSTESQGLLARNTNGRPFEDDTFVILPEVAINMAYQLRPGLDFNVGYNYMMLPKVAQAGQQINDNLAVNLSDPLVGRLDPQLNFDERKYWLHSLGLGLQLRY